MLGKCFCLVLGSIAFFIPPLVVSGQPKFDGAVRNTEDYTNQVPDTTVLSITVFLAGGIGPGSTPASGLTACPNYPNPTGNTVPVVNGYYCFKGSGSSYDIEVPAGSGNKRRIVSDDNMSAAGVYTLTDFGALGDASSDNTYLLKSAMAFIGTRPEPGGKLVLPNGVFKVFGRNAELPVVMPPGLTFEGQNGKLNFGSSRIQLEGTGKTLFRIGNNTNSVTVRDLALMVPLNCDSRGRNCSLFPGNRAIYAAGTPGSSSHSFLASRINIQGFEEGVSVAAIGEDWQFGSARIENSSIADCLYPIRLAAQNAELQISNTVLLTFPQATGQYARKEAAIRIDRSGAVEMNKVYGGVASRNVGSLPLAFIWVTGRHSTIKVIDAESENTEFNLLYDYTPSDYDIKMRVTFENCNFGDRILFKGNVIFTSIGNTYASDGVQFWGSGKGGSSTASEVYSYGDHFGSITTKLHVCPAAPGVAPTGYLSERDNTDFHRLTAKEITPTQNAPEMNVCRRDFYLYNTETESNRVVVRTAGRKYSTGDSDNAGVTQFQAPVKIASPPVFDPNVNARKGTDRLRALGYTIQRNPSDGSLEFIGDQTPDDPSFRFNGGLFPNADNQHSLGDNRRRWAIVRGVVVTSGDTILTDKVTGKELYKIHEDEDFIYFSDIRTGKEMMKIGRDGNLYVTGKVIQNYKADPPKEKQLSIRRKRRPGK